VGKPQDPSRATLTKKIKREDGLVDLITESPQAIYRKWQAYTPWPGIYAFYKGKRIKLIDLDLQNDKLVFIKVQSEGKAVMDYESFVNGNGPLPTT
jgi:methionyl-tRNA formyltransferase